MDQVGTYSDGNLLISVARSARAFNAVALIRTCTSRYAGRGLWMAKGLPLNEGGGSRKAHANAGERLIGADTARFATGFAPSGCHSIRSR